MSQPKLDWATFWWESKQPWNEPQLKYHWSNYFFDGKLSFVEPSIVDMSNADRWHFVSLMFAELMKYQFCSESSENQEIPHIHMKFDQAWVCGNAIRHVLHSRIYYIKLLLRQLALRSVARCTIHWTWLLQYKCLQFEKWTKKMSLQGNMYGKHDRMRCFLHQTHTRARID